MNVEIGTEPRYSFSGNICFKFSAFFLCSALPLPHLTPCSPLCLLSLLSALVNFLCLSLPHFLFFSPLSLALIFASFPSYQLLSTFSACLFLSISSLPTSGSPFASTLLAALVNLFLSSSSSPPYLLLLQKVIYSWGKHFPSPIVGNSALRRGIIL